LTSAAGDLLALHRPGRPLVLPNVWDVASARAVEAAGFPVVATSSLALAEAHGHSDGEQLPVDELFQVLAEISAAVAVPVSADVERGYGLAPTELVQRLAASGVVGCNLEDSDPRTGELVDPYVQGELLADVRAASQRLGWDVVLNARVDAAMHGTGSAEDRLKECLLRAAVYDEAGADCVYPILLEPLSALEVFVGEVGLPVNAYWGAGMGDLARLGRLGLSRVSLGPGLYRADDRQAVLRALATGDDPWASSTG
jgi:2-methylisocitrate lyase-like PEP mutase family enzyme